MKRGTTEHPKTLLLAAELDLPRYAVTGLLESVWHFAAKFTPAGNVGKFPNAMIATSIDWRGDPDALIQAMVASGWLDESAEHRLIVHDWSEHTDDAVHRLLARGHKFFADGTIPKLTRLAKNERESAEQFFARRRPDGVSNASAVRTMDARCTHDGRTADARSTPCPASAPPEPEPRQSQSQCPASSPPRQSQAPPPPSPAPPEPVDGGGGDGDESDGVKAGEPPGGGRVRDALAAIGVRGARLTHAAERLTGTGRDGRSLLRFVAGVKADTASAKSPGAAASARILDPPEADLLAEIDAVKTKPTASSGPSDVSDAERARWRDDETAIDRRRKLVADLSDAGLERAVGEVGKANPAVASAAKRLPCERWRKTAVIVQAVGEFLERAAAMGGAA